MTIDYDGLIDILENIIKNQNLEELSIKNNEILKLQKETKHYSLYFINTLTARILKKKGKVRLEFRPIYKEIFQNIQCVFDKNGWIIIELDNLIDIDLCKKEILEILNYEINHVQGEPFGCCSRYNECSDIKKCVNDNFLLSLGCQYRINLLNNKIFYGINRKTENITNL